MSALPHCWGVGLARTGNTSFCAALGLLGYSAVQQDPTFEQLRDVHAEVRRYFSNRPDDLLELNIAGGQGWEALCPFLGLAAPDQPFPRLNAGVAA